MNINNINLATEKKRLKKSFAALQIDQHISSLTKPSGKHSFLQKNCWYKLGGEIFLQILSMNSFWWGQFIKNGSTREALSLLRSDLGKK